MNFWIGAVVGLFAGSFMGVLLTCILVASRREREPQSVLQQRVRGQAPGSAGIPPAPWTSSKVSGREP